jgi:hypothetical protein
MMQKEVLERRRKLLGEEHGDTITAINNRGRDYASRSGEVG